MPKHPVSKPPPDKPAAPELCRVPGCIACAGAGPVCAAHRTVPNLTPNDRRREKPAARFPLFEAADRETLNAQLIQVLFIHTVRRCGTRSQSRQVGGDQ